MRHFNKVLKIIRDIKQKKETALLEYVEKYDNVKLTTEEMIVAKDEINKSENVIQRDIKKVILNMYDNIKTFHIYERKKIKEWTYKKPGIEIKRVYRPIEKVGIYVPGGAYNYFSTLLMTAIPAKIANVEEIIVTTPPKNITPLLLFCAKICQVDKIYKVGGPMAVAAMAYGTSLIPKVDLIVGPGGELVTLAKKLIYGTAGIDMLAGPTELCIFSDINIFLDVIIKDLIAQAEHGKNSKSIFVTTNRKMFNELKLKIPNNFSTQIEVKFFKKKSQVINFINNLAPEHLQIFSEDPNSIIKSIKNSGEILVGEYSPTVITDYFAGTSHVLPTGGSAKFSSGLSVATFLKSINIIKIEKKYVTKNKMKIHQLANLEGFKHHAESILCR